jgi:hypothetical protein
MQLMEDRPLELDESEMFEDELEDVGPVVADPASLLLSSAPAVAAAALQAAQEEGESESDDDGIVLESECSSSGGGWAARHSHPPSTASSQAAGQLARFPVCRSDEARAAQPMRCRRHIEHICCRHTLRRG